MAARHPTKPQHTRFLDFQPCKLSGIRIPNQQGLCHARDSPVDGEKQLQVRCVMKIQPVLALKRLLLFKEMLTDEGVNDEHLFGDV